jgi:hypothetical protein
VSIRETRSITHGDGFTAQYTAESIRELEEMKDRGEIEPHAYLIKKQALVKLFLKSTTTPQRKRRASDDME